MRIVKLFVLATFLFTATAYSYQDVSCTLRTPIMNNKTGDASKRLEDATKEVAKNTPGLWERFKIWRLSRTDWGKLACAKFTDEKDKAIALQLLEPLVERLSKNKSDSKETISAIVRASQNIDELKLAISIQNTYMDNDLTENNRVIIAMATRKGSTEKRQEAFKAFFSLEKALKDNGLYVTWTLREAMPAIFESARNVDEIIDSLNFGIGLAKEIGKEEGKIKRDVGTTLFGIARMATITNTDNQADMRVVMSAINRELFLSFTSDLGKLARFNSIIAESITNFKELKNVRDTVVPQIIREAKDPRALKFINEGHIKNAIELQKQGGFVIAFDYKGPDKKNGNSRVSMNDDNAKETCAITISPFPTWAAKQGEKLSSNTGLSVSFDKLDYAVIMASAGIMSPESFAKSIDILLENKIENIFVVATQESEIQELKDKIGEMAFKDMVQKGIKFTVPEKSALAAFTAEIRIYENNIFFTQNISVFKLTNKAVIEQLSSGV